MPETAMDEDDRLAAGEDEVRRSRQRAIVEPKAQSLRVEPSPNDELWLGVARPYAPHVPATLLRGMRIRLAGAS